MKTILIILGLILSMFGVICIFDARLITKKMFSFGDQNEATMGLKILGFLVYIVGIIIIYFNLI